MKKIKLSVAALSLALSVNAQDIVDYQRVTTHCDEITFTRFEVIDMLQTISDILEWQNQDMEDGETSMGKHSEGWGSNHWLTLLEKELYNKLQNDYTATCENCDEVD